MAYDSRRVEPGNAFFCIKGLVTDGHLYAADAVGRGAKALVFEREPEALDPAGVTTVSVPDTRRALALCSDRFYGNPSKKLKLVGITGTNGKTTTAFLVKSIFESAGMVTGLIGTVENHVAGTVEPVTRTTPESLDLQRLLFRMVEAGVEVATMEVSSHALELHRVDGCGFDCVVFTNLTQDHLDFHLSLEEYFGAKRKLFEGAGFGADRVALINADDEFGRRLMAETDLAVRSYAVENRADLAALNLVISPQGNSFDLRVEGENVPVSTRLQGRFNVYNCLAAAAVGLVLGADMSSVVEGLGRLEGVPGRFENIDCGQDFTALVDYAHTPDGVKSLLQACREVSRGRVIIVVGCGGDRDRSKRPRMGRVAVEMSDLCVITSDNPRGEEPESIIEMILEGVRDRFGEERYAVVADRREAIRYAVGRAEKGDLLVVAGKGHESGQIFSDGVVPFDDREVLRDCIREALGEES